MATHGRIGADRAIIHAAFGRQHALAWRCRGDRVTKLEVHRDSATEAAAQRARP